MSMRTGLVLAVLSAAALTGSKWMRADDDAPAPLEAPPPVTVAAEAAEASEDDLVPKAPAAADSAKPVAGPKLNAVGDSKIDSKLLDVLEGDEPEHAAPPLTKIGTATEITDPLNKQSAQNLTLEWVGPAQIKVGRPFLYELVVRNIGNIVANDVIIRDKFPEGMRIHSVEPKGTPEAEGYVWAVGNLAPQQEHRIKIRMTAEKKGDVVCNATVTATSPATARFRVSEPQLQIKQAAAEKVMLGDSTTFTVTVTNPGDGPADGVIVKSQLSDGLKHEKGKEFNFDIGSLAGGETRSVQIVCTTTKGGPQTVRSVATAEAGGLITEAESITLVIEPRLNVAIDGPKRRYLDRGATYNVEVSNPGDAAASNVKVVVEMPDGFKFVDCSNGGRHDFTTRTITWFVGTLGGGEKKDLSYKCVAVKIGDQKHLAEATGQRGLKSNAESITGVEGIAALLLEVVDIDDPVEVGADTAYEIRVTNQGSREATNVVIHTVTPAEMVVRGAQGPTNFRHQGQEIVFAPLPKLAPRAVAIYRIFVRGTKVGDARFQSRLTSDSLTDPVIEEESTKVYDD